MTKRIFDVAVAAAGIAVLWPLFLIVAVLIKSNSRGPVFFRQVRVGRGEKNFRIFKFRTMFDAPTPTRKVNLTTANDPRITPVGTILRKYKLDELPQLFNVVAGDMSLVGPRPEVPDYVAIYPRDERKEIFSVRPGVTDNASIVFRNESEILARVGDPTTYYREIILPQKRALSLEYVRRRSLLGDVTIIASTIAHIVRRTATRA